MGARMMKKEKLINPVTHPRYDGVYYKGLKMLNDSNGVNHPGCNYLAQLETVCNKCGKLVKK
jgi:hypothetical protein